MKIRRTFCIAIALMAALLVGCPSAAITDYDGDNFDIVDDILVHDAEIEDIDEEEEEITLPAFNPNDYVDFVVNTASPLFANAQISITEDAPGFIEYNLEYRLEILTDGQWQALPYLQPPSFADHIAILNPQFYAHTIFSDAYIQSWLLSHGELPPGYNYRVIKPFVFHFFDQTAPMHFELSAEFTTTDSRAFFAEYFLTVEAISTNDAYTGHYWLGEIPIIISHNPFGPGWLLTTAIHPDTLIIDNFGYQISVQDIPIGATIRVLGTHAWSGHDFMYNGTPSDLIRKAHIIFVNEV